MSDGLTVADFQQMYDAMVARARASEDFARRLHEFLARISDLSIDPLVAARELGLEEWARRIIDDARR